MTISGTELLKMTHDEIIALFRTGKSTIIMDACHAYTESLADKLISIQPFTIPPECLESFRHWDGKNKVLRMNWDED